MQGKTNVEDLKLSIRLNKILTHAVQLESFEEEYLSTHVILFNCCKTNRCVNKSINLLGSIYALVQYQI
jgi:hypothetical protein